MRFFRAILIGIGSGTIYLLIVKLFIYPALGLPPIKILMTMLLIGIGAALVGWGAGSWIKTRFK